MEKPVFKNCLLSRRCLIPLDGFYEWKRNGKEKIPYRIVTIDQDIFAVAGLWENWKDPVSGEVVHSFTIITRGPNLLMEKIHDRMPAILLKENEHHWLDTEVKREDALQLLIPYPEEQMEAYEVSSRVNHVKENDSELLRRIESKGDFIQTTLF